MKLIPLLKGGFLFSGQERPGGAGNYLRGDLLKKFATAEGISGRLPYSILTKMISLVGWKRIECNKMFQFSDITEDNFESILRRCAVITIAARVVDQAFMDLNCKDVDISDYGVFPRDPDAQELLTSKIGVLAGLQIQHVFELDHSEQECRRIIDEYTRCGKDGGVTLSHVREACGLSEEKTSTPGVAHLLGTPQEHEKLNKEREAACLHEVYQYYIKKLYFGDDTTKASASVHKSTNPLVQQAKDYFTTTVFNLPAIPDAATLLTKECTTDAKRRTK